MEKWRKLIERVAFATRSNFQKSKDHFQTSQTETGASNFAAQSLLGFSTVTSSRGRCALAWILQVTAPLLRAVVQFSDGDSIESTNGIAAREESSLPPERRTISSGEEKVDSLFFSNLIPNESNF